MNPVLAYLDASDRRVACRLRGWAPPRWLRVFMQFATRVGDGWLWLATAALLASDRSRGPQLLTATTAAAAVANVAVVGLKARFRRLRPARDAAGAPRLASDFLAFDRFSFPSGHSLNAFAACSVAALAHPILAPPVLLLAASIGASRVVLGRHFVSDVVAGAALGGAIGGACFELALR